MNGRRIVTLVALSLLVLVPLTAEAAGEVQKVTPSPSWATPGFQVVIIVDGKPEVCNSLDLDFGDGTAHATYTGPLTPSKTFTHTYSSTGTKTITATGVNTCKGQALASLPVLEPEGKITGLAVPSSASPNSPVYIAVQGTGTCYWLHLDFGDGTKTTFPQATFPITAQHSYATTGSKTL